MSSEALSTFHRVPSAAVADHPRLPRATEQDGSYPRPQLMRGDWVDLTGTWGFDVDDDDRGLSERWYDRAGLGRSIVVPFPPESAASGIGDTDFHPVVWYHRELDAATIAAAGSTSNGGRLLVHFGAVDYRASVWVDGQFVGDHEGGHVPFTVDVTEAVLVDRETHTLVVRAEDDPFDVAQPRGKQDWQRDAHSIWYHRTTGIWQPVWLEAVPRVAIDTLHWSSDLPSATVTLRTRLSRRPVAGTRLRVLLNYGEESLAEIELPATSDRVEVTLTLPRQGNGQDYEHILWSPEHPRLLDAVVALTTDSGIEDAVSSYLGLRSAAVEGGAFLLNDRPYYLRSVLSQGYWPESHLAAPSSDALRAEAQLILDLGFNAARIHQKIEDPRFLFWTDKLGLLVWGETPGAFEFSTTAIDRLVAEWSAAIDRDFSHPSIVTWVPLNESWGVQHIAHDQAVRDYSRALFHLTKALDPTRPVVSNDGWEHLDSDLWTIHDYEPSGAVLRERYADPDAVQRLFDGIGPAGRRLRLSAEPDRGQPVMLTEFGGVKYTVGGEPNAAWGYSTASSAEDFAARLGALLDAVRASTVLAGFCYTQLTDTLQETNGLVTDAREPKLPLEVIRAIITGATEA